MKKIIIDPMNCSREEYVDLIDYLDDKCWSYTQEDPPRSFKIVARSHRTKKQAVKRNYTSKEKYDKHGEQQMMRYSRIYGIAEAYELKDREWVLIDTMTHHKPHIN